MTDIVRRRAAPPLGMAVPPSETPDELRPLFNQVQENITRVGNRLEGLAYDEAFLSKLIPELFRSSVFIELLLEWIEKAEPEIKQQIVQSVTGGWISDWYGESLPPVPQSGPVRAVTWKPPHGDNQVWWCSAGSPRWKPGYAWTSKSGEGGGE